MSRHVDTSDQHIGAGKTFDKPCYPNTESFASEPSENRKKVFDGGQSRRPGGSMRGSGPWHTSACDSTDEGRPHATPDERSPNPTPGFFGTLGGMAKNMGKDMMGRMRQRMQPFMPGK